MADFLPRRDIDLVNWTGRFAQGIAADPASLGLTEAQAAGYGQEQLAFATAYRKATEPRTRGLLTVQHKDEARKAITATTRELARLIRAQPGVSVVTLMNLGLRKAGGLAVGAETDQADAEARPPWVSVSAPGRRVTVKVLRDPSQRARPDKAVGAAVFWYAGDVHPASVSGWHLAGNATRPEMSFTLPMAVEPGARLWVCAAWLDRRLRPGQLSNPKQTRVGFGFMLAA